MCSVARSQAAAPRRAPLRVQNFRVNNVEIPNGKRIEVSLQYVYGIGQTTAKAILRDTVRFSDNGKAVGLRRELRTWTSAWCTPLGCIMQAQDAMHAGDRRCDMHGMADMAPCPLLY